MSLPVTPAAPRRPQTLDSVAGDPASREAIAGLRAASARIRTTAARDRKVVLLMRSAVKTIQAGDYAEGSSLALQALELDDRQGLAWRILAIALDKLGDLEKAFAAYEGAVRFLPDETEVAHDLGRLAQRLGYLDIAEKLLSRYLVKHPGDVEATNNLACVLRDQNRDPEAIALLSQLISIRPGEPILWNTLGTVLSERGDAEQSLPFYDEALRLDPGFYKASYNRANVRMTLGDPHTALQDIEAALTATDDPGDVAAMNMAKALTLLLTGDLKQGFETYEVRFDTHLAEAVIFEEFGRRWEPADELGGRTLLVYGEQGLGDEVLFANVLDDVVKALGPEGRLILALEGRLVPLFQRSYPDATVIAHRNVKHLGRMVRLTSLPEPAPDVDYWTPIGSLFRRFRQGVTDFPDHRGFLKPDPERVAHWRAVLEQLGPGPKIGVIWKSLKMTGSRIRHFSPFEMWGPALRVPGAHFVNLQYGDATEDLAAAEAAGIQLWTPPGLDLKMDLDDLAALCLALDGVIGSATATTNIAAAGGTKTWLLSGSDAWTCFGTDRLPCYPSVRVFRTDRPGDWKPAVDRLCGALHELVEAHGGGPQAGQGALRLARTS